MNRISKTFFAIVTLSFVFYFTISPVALAENGTAPNNSYSSAQEAAKKAARAAKDQAKKLTEQKNEAEKQRIEVQKKLEEQKREATKKLSETEASSLKQAKEKYLIECESKHQSFKSKLDNVNNSTNNHINTLSTIDSRIQDFIKNNSITVPNYETLILNVNTQRQLLQNLQDNSTNDVRLFKCGTNPGDASLSLQSYKDNYLQEINAIKTYKQSLKDLISAVKTTNKSKAVNGDR
jgi:hypothetical protein